MTTGSNYNEDNLQEYEANIYLMKNDGHICDRIEKIFKLEIANYQQRICDEITRILEDLANDRLTNPEILQPIVSTGYPGLCYAAFKILEYSDAAFQKHEKIKFKCSNLMIRHVASLEFPGNRKNHSFLTGDVGIYCLMAYYYHKFDPIDEPRSFIDLASSYVLEKVDLSSPESLTNSINERVGYLFGLLFLCHNINTNVIGKSLFKDVCESILAAIYPIDSTISSVYFSSEQALEPLYLTNACGILYNLLDPICITLDCVKKAINNIKTSADLLFKKNYEEIGSTSGMYALVYLAIRCHRVYHEEQYLNIAETLGNLIWNKGPYEESLDLSLGASGNAYGFIALYNYTLNQKYLYYALKLSEWILQKKTEREAMRFSLWNGEVGILCLFQDLMNPSKAKFPGFQAYTDLETDIFSLYLDDPPQILENKPKPIYI